MSQTREYELNTGSFLDVKDLDNKWLEAVIVHRTPHLQFIKVHYLGWSDRWDEELNITTQEHRLAPLHKWSSWTASAPIKPTEEQAKQIEKDLQTYVHFKINDLVWVRAVKNLSAATRTGGTGSPVLAGNWQEAVVTQLDGLQLMIKYAGGERWIHLKRWVVRVRRKHDPPPTDDLISYQPVAPQTTHSLQRESSSNARASPLLPSPTSSVATPSSSTSLYHNQDPVQVTSTPIPTHSKQPSWAAMNPFALPHATAASHHQQQQQLQHSRPSSSAAGVASPTRSNFIHTPIASTAASSNRTPSTPSVVASPSHSYSATPTPSFEINQSLDARDALGKWLPARIVDMEDRGPLITSSGGAQRWEMDATGVWQPRGGVNLLIHFEGFQSKWDEWIHASSFLPSLTSSLGPSIRPRLAPADLLVPHTNIPTASLTSHGLRVGERVEVQVFVPLEMDDELLTDPSLNHNPQFISRWVTAVILTVDHAQLQVKYEPALPNSASFRFPQWFHVQLSEIRRLGMSLPVKMAVTANSNGAAAEHQVSTYTKPPNLLLSHNRSSSSDLDAGVTPDMSAGAASARRQRLELASQGFTSSASTPNSAATTPMAASNGKPSPLAINNARIHNGRSTATPSPSTVESTPSSSIGSSFLSTFANFSILPTSNHYATGKLCDVRSIEDGLWSEAKVIVNEGDRNENITVKLLDRNTTQLIDAIDVPYMLAPHQKYSSGEVSPRYELNDRIRAVLHTISEDSAEPCIIEGQIKQFKQGQMLINFIAPGETGGVKSEFWINPHADRVEWIGKGVAPVRTPKSATGTKTYSSNPLLSSPAGTTSTTTATPAAKKPPPAPEAVSKSALPPPQEPESTLSSLTRMFGFNNNVVSPGAASSPTSAASKATLGLPLPATPSAPSSPAMQTLSSPRSIGAAGVPGTTTTVAGLASADACHAFYTALIRRSLSAALRAPVGVVNLGNTCYMSAGLQALAGLQPMVQYFVLDSAHKLVLERRIQMHNEVYGAKTGRLSSPSSSSSSSILSPSATKPFPPLTKGFGDLTMEFAHVLNELYTGEGGSRMFPDQLKRLVVNLPNDAGSRFRGMGMQDAHEFLAVLFNALQNELNTAVLNKIPTSSITAADKEEKKSQDKDKRKEEPPVDPVAQRRVHWTEFYARNTDPISHLFYAQSRQYVICSACKFPSCNHHVMGQLTLDIPQAGNQPKAAASSYMSSYRSPSKRNVTPVTLQQCMSTQLVVEQLEDYYCSRCERKNRAHTSMYYTLLPPVLLIQLKRFDLTTDGGRKDETPCQYPLELDASFLLQPHPSIMPLILNNKNNTSSQTVDNEPINGGNSTKYHLTGVVMHFDHHYTAFTKVRTKAPPSTARSPKRSNEPDDGAWCFFNDSRSTMANEDDVLAEEKNVYLLVYQRNVL